MTRVLPGNVVMTGVRKMCKTGQVTQRILSSVAISLTGNTTEIEFN